MEINVKIVASAVIVAVLLITTMAAPAFEGNRDYYDEEGRDNSTPRELVCKLPPMRGHCRALLIRWRYNPELGRCTEFKFGGCDGNGNNFRSEAQCMTKCKGIA